MAPSDITKFLSPAAGNSLAASLTSLSRRQPSAASSPPPQSTLSAAASFISRKLSLNRRKRASQDPISTFESTFDAEVKRARLSSTFGVASSASSPSPSTPEASDFDANENLSAAMNGHRSLELRFGPASSGPMSSKPNKSPPVASLCNLGNTCFLNSVLYTLRFTPGFLHSLHHMVHDLGLNGSGGKSSSKRSNGLAAQQGQTNGSTNSIADAETELVHDVIDQLHELFRTLSGSDESDSKDPLPPSNFLTAVGKLNPMFEGNQQQDAHEMLGYIINLLQEIKIPAAAISDANDENKNGNLPEKSEPAPPSDKKLKKKSAKSTFLSSSNSNLLANSVPAITSSLNGTSLKSPSPTMTSTSASTTGGSGSKATEPASLPNFVKDNFVGKSVMGTKCLECETSTYRSETFTNIDIPLTFEDDEESMSVTSLFLREILAKETLRENNKYWCAECSRLNEAERSVQYEVLPRIMVLQLKRFTANGNKNYMSKINDYIPTPLSMNCFCTECLPTSGTKEPAKHHYRLYAVIMHLGATLASGHYIAYVRATDLTLDYLNCLRNSTVERKNKKGILKYFSRSSDVGRSSASISNGGSAANGVASTNGISSSGSGSEPTCCKSINCCGIRTLGQLLPAQDASSSLPPIPNSLPPKSSEAGKDFGPDLAFNGSSSSSHKSGSFSSSNSSSSDADDVWLECDDDSIAVITRKQFEEELGSKQSSTTPYLLFYQRI